MLLEPRRQLELAKIVVITAGLLALCVRASAQRYPIHVYEENDGLPNSAVYSVTQAADGRMWFALRGSVAWYDGAEWNACREADGLPSGTHSHVLASPTGRIYAITSDLPLRCSLYEDGRWTRYPDPVSAAGDREGEVRAAALLTLPSDNTDVVLVSETTDRLARLHGGEWTTVRMEGGPSRVHAIVDFQSEFLLATAAGLMSVQPRDDLARSKSIPGVPDGGVLFLTVDPSTNALWIAGTDWIGVLRDGGFDLLSEGMKVDFGTLVQDTAAAAGPGGGLYFGNVISVYYFHRDMGVRPMSRESGLSGNGTTSLLRDREGNVWVTSLRGVSKILGRQFASYDSEHGLADDEVTSVLHRRSGEVVLGYQGMVSVGFPVSRKIRFATDSSHSRVLDLEEDAAGRVWCAAMSAGVGRFDEDWNVTWYLQEHARKAPTTSLATDANGVLWAGTENGVFRFEDDEFRHVPLNGTEGSRQPYVRRLLATSWGSLVVGTYRQGVFELTEKGVQHYPSPTLLGGNVYSLFEVSPRVLWVGAIDGMYRVTPDGYQRVDIGDRNVRRPVYFITQDSEARYWIGTDNGVWRVSENESRLITTQDGLIGSETNRDAGSVDAAGLVWIGTDSGLTIYDPRFDHGVGAEPTVELLDVVSGENAQSSLLPATFDRRLDDLTFRFRVISFRDEQRLLVRSRLEGLEKEWHEPRRFPIRELSYLNLLPGTYRLHLQAIDIDGRTSSEVVSAPIRILPAWWRRPEAIVVFVILLFGFAWSVTAFVVQRRYARRLEIDVATRTKELDELHAEIAKAQKLEAVGLLAGGIAHDFNNLLTGILGNLSLVLGSTTSPAESRASIGRAIDATRRARTLTQQLLTFSRGGTPIRQASGIGNLLRESAEFVLHGTSHRVTLDIADDLRDVEIDAGQMNQVVQNLVLNARDAVGESGHITVTARNLDADARSSAADGPRIVIEVSDDGVGIPPEDLSRVFDPYFSTKPDGSGLGLAIAHSIVKNHEGSIDVESVAGEGTVFRIELPALGMPRHRDEAHKDRAGAPRRGARVLVMDDEEYVRDVLRSMLERLEYEVVTTADGREAVDRYEAAFRTEAPFDVVLMDLTVRGGMGGREAIAQLIEIDPKVRAIVASGYSNDPVLSDPEVHGFASFLEKPFVFDDLALALERVLGERRETTRSTGPT